MGSLPPLITLQPAVLAGRGSLARPQHSRGVGTALEIIPATYANPVARVAENRRATTVPHVPRVEHAHPSILLLSAAARAAGYILPLCVTPQGCAGHCPASAPPHDNLPLFRAASSPYAIACGKPVPRAGRIADGARKNWLARTSATWGLRTPSAKRRCGRGSPAIQPDFPAFAVRSSRIRYTGRKRRSCSPV